MNKITERILPLLDKYQTADEIAKAWQIIKTTLMVKLETIQKQSEENTQKIKSQIQELAGNQPN